MATGGDTASSERRRSTHLATPAIITPVPDAEIRCMFCDLTENEARKNIKIQRWVECSTCGGWIHISCLNLKLNRKGTVPTALWEKIITMQSWIFCCPEKCGDFRPIPQQLQTQGEFSYDKLLALGVRKGHLLKPEDTDSKIITKNLEDGAGNLPDDQQNSDAEMAQEQKWKEAGARPKGITPSVFPPAPPTQTVPLDTAAVPGISGNVDVMQLMAFMFSKMQQKDERDKEFQSAQLAYQQQKEKRDRQERAQIREEESKKWDTIQKLLERSSGAGSSVEQPHTGISTKVKLPTIDLPKFNGDILKWKEFWDLFENLIHKNSDLSNVEKFTFLKGSLVGTAATEIEACRITDDNYDAVIQRLKNRYDNDMIIEEHLFLQLQNLPVPGNRAADLRKIYNTITTICTQLTSLGQDLDSTNLILVMILQKIPPSVRVRLEEKKGHLMKWSYTLFRQYFEEYICALEQSWMTKDLQNKNMDGQKNKPAISHSTSGSREQSEEARYLGRGTGATLVAGDVPKSENRKIWPCIFCEQTEHLSADCAEVTSVDLRKKILRNENRCFVCLKRGHDVKDCFHRNKKLSCAGCGKTGEHHRAICKIWVEKKFPTNQNDNAQEGLQALQPSGTPGVQCHATEENPMKKWKSVLQTCSVEVCRENGGCRMRNAKVLFDGGSDETWVDGKFAKTLGLPHLGRMEGLVQIFGTKEPIRIKGYHSKIRFKTNKGFKDYWVRVMDSLNIKFIHNPVTIEDVRFLNSHPKIKSELAKDTMRFDMEQYLYEPDIVIGMDLYYEFIKITEPGIQLPSGLVMTPTKFGYIICGSIMKNQNVVMHNTVSSLTVVFREEEESDSDSGYDVYFGFACSGLEPTKKNRKSRSERRKRRNPARLKRKIESEKNSTTPVSNAAPMVHKSLSQDSAILEWLTDDEPGGKTNCSSLGSVAARGERVKEKESV